MGLIMGLILCGFANAATYNCDSCSDCESKINSASAGDTIQLTADITDYTNTCIEWGNSDITFDCQGHMISGDDTILDHGIYLNGKSGNIIKNCVITDFHSGIRLEHSSNNIILNNTLISNDWEGIDIYSSSKNNTLMDNIAISNRIAGISLYTSPNNILANNIMVNNSHNFGIWGVDISQYYQDIDTSNTVDGKPIYYWTNSKNAPNNCRNSEVPQDAGFVALVSCDNITVKNLDLHNNSLGILLANTTNSKILNNTLSSYCWFGIILDSSSDNILADNIANSNILYGIILGYCSNNTLTDNIANSNGLDGIHLGYSSNNTLINNNASLNGEYGIHLRESSNSNNLINNTLNTNQKHGLYIDSFVTGNILNSNTFCSNNQSSGSYYDIYDKDSNSGDDNTCDTTYNWNDEETTGCTYPCHYYLQYNISLISGWNQISTPLEPKNTSIEAVIAGLLGHIIVDTYNTTSSEWHVYDSLLPGDATLHEMVAGKGYWLYSGSDQTLIVEGREVESFPINLYYGWNLIGYSNLIEENIFDVIPPHYLPVVVLNYDALGDFWKVYNPTAPSFLNTVTKMAPGKGYWVKTLFIPR